MSNDHPGTTDSTTGPAESAIDPQSRNSPDPAHAVTENLSAIAADVAAVTHDLAAERQTTSQPESDSSVPHQPLPPETDAVEFRVMRSGSPVRRLRLSGHRYTFGSGEGCSIRLSDPALRPMHAVLIRDLHRILVRAYSVPLEINGQRLAEATLELGDVMRMGAYRFELIGVSIADDDAHAGFQRAIADQQLPPAHAFAQPKGIQSDLPTAFGEAGSVLDQTAPGPGDEESLWRQRLRNEVEQWRARQADCDRRHARCDQREASLRNRESELWSQAEKLRQREKQLKSQESAALQIQAEYAEKQHELELIREESRDQQRDFERREAEFKQSEAEYQQRVDEASAQLHQSQQQAASATEAVQRMREQFTSLNEQLEALTSQQTTIERREQERTTEFQKTCDDLEHARDQAIAQRDVANHERDEAIDRHARSEAARHEIEDQIDELSQLLQQAEQNLSAERERYVASELDAETLRKQVIELQENVQEAGEEASRLREGYERACEQVRDLERMAADSQNRSESDRSSWLVEADQLRSSVETMSIQLVAANGELTQLRQSNEELIEKLAEAQEQRDEAQQQRDEIKQQRDHAQRQCDDAEVKLQEACEDRDHAVDAEKRLLAERDASDQALAQAIEERARAIEDSDRAVEQLHQAIRDRDQSSDELRTRPTAEAWEQLRQELKAANDQIAELTQQYEQTLQRLDDAGTSETGPAELAPPVWGLESDADSTEDPETESVSTSGWSDTAFGPESTVGQESANDPEASVESFDVQRDDTAADSTSWGNANDTLGLSTRESLALDTATADTSNDEPVDGPDIATGPVAETESDESTAEDGWPTYHVTEADVWAPSRSEEETALEKSATAPEESATDPEDPASVPEDLATAPQGLASESDHATKSHLQSEPFQYADEEEQAADSLTSSWQVASEEEDDTSTFDLTPAEPVGWSTELPAVEEPFAEPSEPDEESIATNAWSPPTDMGPEEVFADDQSVDLSPLPDQQHDETRDVAADSTDSSSVSGSLASLLIADLDREDVDSGPDDSSVSEGQSIEHTSPFDIQGLAEQDADRDTPVSWGQDPIDPATAEESSLEPAPTLASELAMSDNTSDLTDGGLDYAQGYLEEAESASEPPGSVSVDEPETPASQGDPADGTQSDEPVGGAPEDDSIEAYMNRLLQRVQTGPEPPAPAQAPVTQTAPTTDELPETTDTSEEITSAESTSQPIDPAEPLVPRSQAPEKNSNLSAMRELANYSARSAISRSTKIQTRNTQMRAFGRFASAGAAVICGMAVFVAISGVFGTLGALAGFVLAGFFTYEGFTLFQEARRRQAMIEAGREAELAKEDERGGKL